MRQRLSLCTAAVLLLFAWLAVTTVSRSGENRFVLEVPAAYISVGQQFQPQLSSLAATAAVPPVEVALELRDGRGQRLAAQTLSLDGAAIQAGEPWTLPQPGSYTLHASAGTEAQTIVLHALAEPSADYGGVLPVASLGLAPGVAAYLQQHSFAVAPLAAAAAARLVVVGDARLDGGDLVGQYAQLWRTVAAGTPALLLQPPPPGVALAWPLTAPLAPPVGTCSDDLDLPPLGENLNHDAALDALLRPPLSFDLRQQTALDLYHWDGRRLLRPNSHSGYEGCWPLFSFRYGNGWVTVSTLPLVQRFQDVRARILLMNLLRAVVARKRAAPASPGLAWVMQQRLKSLAATSTLSSAAVFYRPPPAATAPVERLLAAASDGDPGSCWSPEAADAGATLILDLRRPQPVHTLTLAFSRWPSAFHLAASPDGRHWTPLAAAAPATGALVLPLPDGAWQTFHLTLAAPSLPAWRLCQFSVQ